MKTLAQAIARACLVGEPCSKERRKALKSVKWTLRSGSLYVGPVDPATLETPLVSDRSQALVFDGRDNHVTRAAFFSRLFGAPFTPEII